MPVKISDIILTFWYKIINLVSIFEIGIVLGIIFSSFLLQNFIQRKYHSYLNTQKKTHLHAQIISLAVSFTGAIATFLLLSIAMTISASFTHHLEIYRISIKLTFVWFIWIFLWHSIQDIFLRWVSFFTLIPLLVFAAFGLADPVINYLDSLGFSLGDVRISIFLILKGLFIVSCLFWCARFISHYVNSLIENQKKISVEIRDLMQNIFQTILYTTISLLTLDLLGIDLKSLAIIGGAIGIGIGLGLQRIAANFISGIILLFEQNVKVGHLVQVSGGSGPGWIRHLGARAAVIDIEDGKEILVPNEELVTKSVINWTAQDKKTRIDLFIKVSFDSDLEKAKEVMLEVVSLHPIHSKLFAPACFLQKFTDNGAQFLLQFWVDDISLGTKSLQHDILLTIWKRFSETNIKFPVVYQT